MARMIVVQWTDATGSGFQPQEPADAPAPRRFWRAAEELRLGDVAQPPGELSHTEGVPIWGLRLSNVEDVRYWCFTVQGRGGVFGNAGTCRFGFLPAEETAPADAWRIGVEEVAAEDPRGDADEKVVEAAVRDVLAAVLLERPIIAIDGQPADAAVVIGRVLHALPAKMASRWHWSSCLIGTPDARRQLVAAGPPEEFAAVAPAIARRAERILGRPQPAVNELLSGPGLNLSNGFSWLVAQAQQSLPLDKELQEAGYGGSRYLNEVAVKYDAMYDVGVAVLSPDMHATLLRQGGRLKEWVAGHHEEAWEVMRDNVGAPIERELFKWLHAEQVAHPGENVLMLPVASRAPDEPWLQRLATLLSGISNRSTRKLLESLAATGGIYADSADRRALRPYLDLLGVPGQKPYATGDAAFAWACLRDERLSRASVPPTGPDRIPLLARDEIALLPQPIGDLRETLPKDAGEWLRVPDVAALVAAAWTASDKRKMDLSAVDRLVSEIGDATCPQTPETAGQWVLSLHDHMGAFRDLEVLLAPVLSGALAAVARIHPNQYFPQSVLDVIEQHQLKNLPPEVRRLLPPPPPPTVVPPVEGPGPRTGTVYVAPDRQDNAELQATKGGARPSPAPPPIVIVRPTADQIPGPTPLWKQKKWIAIGAATGLVVVAGLVATVKADSRPPAKGADKGSGPLVTAPRSPSAKASPSTKPSVAPVTPAQPITLQFFPDQYGPPAQQLAALIGLIRAQYEGRSVSAVTLIGYGASSSDGEFLAQTWLTQLGQNTKSIPKVALKPPQGRDDPEGTRTGSLDLVLDLATPPASPAQQGRKGN